MKTLKPGQDPTDPDPMRIGSASLGAATLAALRRQEAALRDQAPTKLPQARPGPVLTEDQERTLVVLEAVFGLRVRRPVGLGSTGTRPAALPADWAAQTTRAILDQWQARRASVDTKA